MAKDMSKPASIGRINQVRAIIKDTVPVVYLSEEAKEQRSAARSKAAEANVQLQAVRDVVKATAEFEQFAKDTPVELTREQYDALRRYGLQYFESNRYWHGNKQQQIDAAIEADPMVIRLEDEVRQWQQEAGRGEQYPQRELLIRAGKAATEKDLQVILDEAAKYAQSGGETR